MKIRCAKERLVDGLHLVGRTVSVRTPLPILECILLTADADGIRLMANDLEMSIETAPLPADVDVGGSVALEAKLFSEIVRKMPGDEIHIEVKENNETICKSGKARFTIMGMPGDEFPVMESLDKTDGYKLSAKEFREMIRQTIFSVATDDSKPVLTGELIQHRESSLNIVAVDGFRISYRRMNLPDIMPRSASNEPVSVVVPAKALHEISRILPTETEDTLTFYFTDKRIVFDLPNFTFVSRLLEGEFIRYDQIFNEDFTTNVTVGRQDFLSGLERATLVARENKKSPVKLEIMENSVIITSNTEMGTAYDEIKAEVDGSTLEIAFNPKYLIEALRAIEEDNIIARFTTGLSPCIIRGVESDAAKYLILPLRLRG